MSTFPTPVVFGLFLAAVIAARILQERALRRLSTEDKGRLVEAFSGYRMIALIPLAAIAGIYFTMSSFGDLTSGLMLAIYLPATLVLSLVIQIQIYRKLRAMELDPEYLRAYSIGRCLVFTTFALVLLVL